MSVAEQRGRTALVTGGTSGIRPGTAHLFTDAGAHIIVIDEDPHRGKLAATQLGGTRFLPASFADLGDVDLSCGQIGIIHPDGGAMVDLRPYAPEFGPHAIRVNSVAPRSLRTENALGRTADRSEILQA